MRDILFSPEEIATYRFLNAVSLIGSALLLGACWPLAVFSLAMNSWFAWELYKKG